MIVFCKDEDDVIEIPVGLGPNVGPDIIRHDPFLEMRAGSITDLSEVLMPAITRDNQYQYLCYNCKTLVKIPDMSNVKHADNENCMSVAFYMCSDIEDVDMSALETINGRSACNSMFSYCSSVKKVNLHNLREIHGYNACYYMFQNCTALEEIDLSSLTSIWHTSSSAREMFRGCNAIKKLTSHPYVLTKTWNTAMFPFEGCSTTDTELILTDKVTDDMRLYNFGLTKESVYHVLTMLDLNVSGKTVTFKISSEYTDWEDGRMQAAYDMATAAGWILSGLTINPYEE